MEEINYYKYIKYKYKYLILNNDKQIGGTIKELNAINDKLKYYNACNNVSNCSGKIDELNKLKRKSEDTIKILKKQRESFKKEFNQIIANLITDYRRIDNDIKQYQKIANQKIKNPKLITEQFNKLEKINKEDIDNNLKKINYLTNDKTKHKKLSDDFNKLFSKLNKILKEELPQVKPTKKTPKPILDTHYVGIRNIDQDCFFNSVLQLMYQLTDFNDKLKSIVNKDNIIIAYKKFLNVYDYAIRNKKKSIYARDIKKEVFKEGKRRPKNTQQDAQEYLGYLLDDILTSIGTKNNIKELIEIEIISELKTAIQCNKSPSSKNDEYINILSLEINESLLTGSDINFNTYLEIVSEEIMKDDNSIYCDYCNIKHSFLKKLIYKFNKYVLIQMKIYDNLINKININLDNLMTEQITLNDKQYNLIGFIVHRGSNLKFGHYMSYTKKHGKWIKYDDSITSIITNINNIPSDESKYVYLYERID